MDEQSKALAAERWANGVNGFNAAYRALRTGTRSIESIEAQIERDDFPPLPGYREGFIRGLNEYLAEERDAQA